MRMNIGAILAVVMLAALDAGCRAPGSVESTPPPTYGAQSPVAGGGAMPSECPAETEQKVTITFAPNPKYPKNPDTCDLWDVRPGSVEVCRGDTIKWEFVNQCPMEVTAHIGARKRLLPKGTVEDPLSAMAMTDLKPSPHPIPTASPGAVSPFVIGTIDPSAEPGHYKYTIVFMGAPIDPEIDVRRGTRDSPEQEYVARPAPTSSPSPAGSR
jgi:hypothetical protein